MSWTATASPPSTLLIATQTKPSVATPRGVPLLPMASIASPLALSRGRFMAVVATTTSPQVQVPLWVSLVSL